MKTLSKNIMIGTIVVTVAAIICSFIPWFSFYALRDTVKATGWNGSVEYWDITIENWMITLLVLLYLMVLLVKNLKIWNPNLWWFVPLLIPIVIHMIGFFTYLFDAPESEEVKLLSGYFLMLVVIFSCILLSVNLTRVNRKIRNTKL